MDQNEKSKSKAFEDYTEASPNCREVKYLALSLGAVHESPSSPSAQST